MGAPKGHPFYGNKYVKRGGAKSSSAPSMNRSTVGGVVKLATPRKRGVHKARITKKLVKASGGFAGVPRGATSYYPHGRSIKNPATYEALVRKGYSKSKAAAISNAALNKTGHRGQHRSAAGKAQQKALRTIRRGRL